MGKEIEVRANIRDAVCKGENCPLRIVLQDVVERERLAPGMTLSELRNICQALELTPANDSYGKPTTPERLRGADDMIFTADCVKGIVQDTEPANCGSVMAYSITRLPQNKDERVLLAMVRASWRLKNQFSPSASSNPTHNS